MADEIIYRLATPEDYNQLTELALEYFFPDEPMCTMLDLDKSDYISDLLFENIFVEPRTSFVAECGGKIVAIRTCGAKDDSADMIKLAAERPDSKTGIIMQFVVSQKQDANVYEKYNVNRAMYGYMLVVHKDFRGKGIGQVLYEKTIERARQLGYPLYTCLCTSIFSARLCERLGMECVREIKFEDYRLPHREEQVFFPKGVHKCAKTFAMKLYC